MSQKFVETITGKTLLDPFFRDVLLADPDRALSGFDLTESEIAGLKLLDSETLDLLTHTLEMRVAQIDPGAQNAFFRSGKKK